MTFQFHICVFLISDAFAKDDFALCIQNRFQCDMLKKFGNNTVCIDSTHSTNHYNFPLTTLMVVDEFGEGIPVAFMISNHETAVVMEAFFKAIKSRVGIINPHVFMSDDAPQYFSAWQKQFGENTYTQKLLCRWHLDKTWRRAIQDKVPKENQPEVYHNLLVLLNESTQSEFTKQLQGFLTFLSNNQMATFLEYFKENYCSRISQWATYARCYTPVNTNMHIEAFHRLVKVVYFQQKQNRRVDALIRVLLRLCRDKVFERLQKLEKGKSTHRISEIHKRHKNATEIGFECIQPLSSECWKINSQNGPNFYTIRKCLQSTSCRCPLRCSYCSVYTCTHAHCWTVYYTVQHVNTYT